MTTAMDSPSPDPPLLKALVRRDFLRSSWPWRSVGYVLGGGLAGLGVLIALVACLLLFGVASILIVGLPFLASLAFCGVPVGHIERRRLRLLGGEQIADPHRPAPPGLWNWFKTRFHEIATWRELGYTILFTCGLWVVDLLVVLFAVLVPVAMIVSPLFLALDGNDDGDGVDTIWRVNSYPEAFGVMLVGILMLVVAAYCVTVYAAGRAAIARLILSPSDEELGAHVQQLSASRARIVDSFQLERRRIERDLHDGAQQRLVALTMSLGLARLDAGDGPLGQTLTQAHGEAKEALQELRDLIQGIHPQVLTDRGLPDAVADLADRSPVPVDVHFDLPDRLPEHIEVSAYFAICEALANVARHSGAARARVEGGVRKGTFIVTVSDDGVGGADPAAGSGIAGLADRLGAVDGKLSVSSPVGGPTELRMEIPCPRTAFRKPKG
jgi:signal transduction histidine kinase